jgi:hypothetical protein
VFIDELTGIFNPEPEDDGVALQIVPNPVKDVFTFNLTGVKSQQAFLQLTDVRGQVVFSQDLIINGNSYSNRINMSYLPKGIYVLKIDYLGGSAIEKVLLQ